MHAVRDAKFLMLLSCAEGLARDPAPATRGAMIQMGWTGASESGPQHPSNPSDRELPVGKEGAFWMPGPQWVPRQAGWLPFLPRFQCLIKGTHHPQPPPPASLSALVLSAL